MWFVFRFQTGECSHAVVNKKTLLRHYSGKCGKLSHNLLKTCGQLRPTANLLCFCALFY